jgi:hypothetical protein
MTCFSHSLRRKVSLSFATGLLAIALCAGCGRSTTTTVEGPNGETVVYKEKGRAAEATFKNSKGEEVHVATGEGGVALPDKFPKDIAIYTKATVATSATVEKTMQVSLKTDDKAKQVEAFYKEKLAADGWKIGSTMNMPNMTMLQCTKDTRTLVIGITSDSGATMIQITVTEERK